MQQKTIATRSDNDYLLTHAALQQTGPTASGGGA
jgi:hypothetical protein